MKTTFSLREIEKFLSLRTGILSGSLTQLTEGHSSQVVGFATTDNKRLVIRIRDDEQDLLADKYAFEHFSGNLPIPKVLEVGRFDYNAYFCISQFVEGNTVISLERNSFNEILPNIHDIFAATFHTDITSTQGYGDINVITGSGQQPTYKEFLKTELKQLDVEKLRVDATTIGLSDKLVDKLVAQFEDNLPYVSEVRRLTHGDPGGDNLIVNKGLVTGVIDWEQMAYGDWVRDFSRFGYFGNNQYGDALTFAKQFHLEADSLDERKAVYWAINALRDIEFAATRHDDKVAQRLRKELQQKIL